MRKATVVGGGIVGVASALALQAAGRPVTLVDRGDLKAAASYGNCGLLAAGEIVPISRPGVLRKIPGWLADPKGPLHIRPKALAPQLPWLLKFLLAGRASRVKQIASGMAPLLGRAEADWEELLADAAMPDALVRAENLFAYDARADFDSERFSWATRALHGFDHRFVDQDELREMEPALGGPIRCGAIARGWLHFSDPGLILTGLQRMLVARGGQIVTGDVVRIGATDTRATALHLADGGRLPVEDLVLAAGAWSGGLARDLGLRIPVAALQGYHHQLPHAGVKLNRAILYSNGGFVLTPLSTGLRIGGTIEIAGHDPRPDFRRADILAGKARAVLPGLDTSGGEQWMGPRPFMPDTMPVIGRSPAHSNVVLAFGHGQVGQTLAATTGKLVAAILTGQPPVIDMSAYSPARF